MSAQGWCEGAQRRLQLSAAVADSNGEVRMIPIAFEDASTPHKPRKGSDDEAVQAYREQMKQRNLNAVAVEALESLQDQRAEENEGIAPDLHVVVDGSYTNKKMLRKLPAHTTLIGRIRKDVHLAAIKTYGQGGKPVAIPPAKWRNPTKKKRPSTQDLINANPTSAARYLPLPHDTLKTKLQSPALKGRAECK